jgi:hypothetical protein
MIRMLPFALDLVLLVFCLIDCIVAEQARVRNLPKWGWILLIIIVPLVGAIAWLLAGRPARRTATQQPAAPVQTWEHPPFQRPLAPDDDPEFIAKLKRTNSEHERLLKRWEEDLRRREDEMRRQEETDGDPEPKPEDR